MGSGPPLAYPQVPVPPVVEMQRARSRARRLYRSVAFQNAYVRGARAALNGKPADDCPYDRKPGWRAWRRAWTSGHASVPKNA